jgi:hypothetical protein
VTRRRLTTFEIGGGTAWVANRTTAFAGRDVIVDSIDVKYYCSTGDYIDSTTFGQMDMSSPVVLSTSDTNHSGMASYTLAVASAFSGSSWLELVIYSDDSAGYCRVTWFADYHY